MISFLLICLIIIGVIMLNNCQGLHCLRRQLKSRKIIWGKFLESHLTGVHFPGQFSGWQFFWVIISGQLFCWRLVWAQFVQGLIIWGANFRGDNLLGTISWETIICWAKICETIVRSAVVWGAIDRGQRVRGGLSRGQLQWGQLPRSNYPEGNCAAPKDPIHIIIWRI